MLVGGWKRRGKSGASGAETGAACQCVEGQGVRRGRLLDGDFLPTRASAVTGVALKFP